MDPSFANLAPRCGWHFSKNATKYRQDFLKWVKLKRWRQIIILISDYLSFDIENCLFFIWPVLEARAEILVIFYCFFGKFKTPKICSEINWLLGFPNIAGSHPMDLIWTFIVLGFPLRPCPCPDLKSKWPGAHPIHGSQISTI